MKKMYQSKTILCATLLFAVALAKFFGITSTELDALAGAALAGAIIGLRLGSEKVEKPRL